MPCEFRPPRMDDYVLICSCIEISSLIFYILGCNWWAFVLIYILIIRLIKIHFMIKNFLHVLIMYVNENESVVNVEKLSFFRIQKSTSHYLVFLFVADSKKFPATCCHKNCLIQYYCGRAYFQTFQWHNKI